jgi:hypothetical protein
MLERVTARAFYKMDALRVSNRRRSRVQLPNTIKRLQREILMYQRKLKELERHKDLDDEWTRIKTELRLVRQQTSHDYVGDQLGSAYRSNNAGDGPFPQHLEGGTSAALLRAARRQRVRERLKKQRELDFMWRRFGPGAPADVQQSPAASIVMPTHTIPHFTLSFEV